MAVIKEVCIIICIGTLVSVCGQMNLASSSAHIPISEGAFKQKVGIPRLGSASGGSSLSLSSRSSTNSMMMNDLQTRNGAASIRSQPSDLLGRNSPTSIRSSSQNIAQQQQQHQENINAHPSRMAAPPLSFRQVI